MPLIPVRGGPPGSDKTSTGVDRFSVVPSPSWPKMLFPQHFAVPSVARAQMWPVPPEPPALIAATPAASAGRGLGKIRNAAAARATSKASMCLRNATPSSQPECTPSIRPDLRLSRPGLLGRHGVGTANLRRPTLGRFSPRTVWVPTWRGDLERRLRLNLRFSDASAGDAGWAAVGSPR